VLKPQDGSDVATFTGLAGVAVGLGVGLFWGADVGAGSGSPEPGNDGSLTQPMLNSNMISMAPIKIFLLTPTSLIRKHPLPEHHS
jgi:hypothetical protein